MIFERIENTFIQWNTSFKAKIASLCPPGYEIKGEYRAFWIWLFVSVGYSLKFLVNYDRAYADLFYHTSQGLRLNGHMKMLPFEELLEDSMGIFLLGIFFLVLIIGLHYRYYRKDSKSVYVMKRLKDPAILWKTYVGTPIIYGLIFLGTGLCLLGLYYGIYRWMTPDVCLPQGVL